MWYILLGVLVLAIILMVIIKGLTTGSKTQDSMLKQRAVFTAQQQLIFARLKEILPNYSILAHVSYDALLTTKFLHTRAKYRNMVADFVILDEHYQVLVVITLENMLFTKKGRDVIYEEEILKSAGYPVIHYKGIPESTKLRLELKKYINEETQPTLKSLKFLSCEPEAKMIS